MNYLIRKIILSFCILFLSYNTYCHPVILPGKTDTINYTIALFELPYNSNAEKYEITLTNSDDTSNPLFWHNISSNKNYLLINSLSFNTTYHWKYRYYDKTGSLFYTSSAFSLIVAGSWLSDTLKYRNVIAINKKDEILNGYIILDNGSIMDRTGKVVWTFPINKFENIRDLRLNNDGNLTFLYNSHAYETDLRGNILWKSPDTVGAYIVKSYHHELRKLNNGDFLCLAERSKGNTQTDIMYSFIFETDKNNNIKWIWDEETNYANDPDFKGAHLNSAYYNEKTKELYISNRDLSSIAKINVVKNKIEYAIGYDYKNDIPFYAHNSFNMQHSLSVMDDGSLLLFNNNSSTRDAPSTVLILSQPTKGKLPSVTWEYVFNFKNKNENSIRKLGDVFPVGNNLMICMGANEKTLELKKDKTIVWEAHSEQFDTLSKQFTSIATGYRADFTGNLYPCYFVAYVNDGKLTIDNAGSEQDIYTCSFIKDNKIIKTVKTKLIDGGKKVDLPVLKTADKAEVTSGKNPSHKKQFNL